MCIACVHGTRFGTCHAHRPSACRRLLLLTRAADLHLQTFTYRPSPADLYLQTFTRGGTAAFKRAAVVLLEDAWPEDELETGMRTPAAVAALTGLALAMAR